MMHQVTEPAAFEAELNRYLGPLVTELGAADDGDAWLAPSKLPELAVAVLAELEHNRTVAAKTVNAAAAGLRAWWGRRASPSGTAAAARRAARARRAMGCAADGVSGGVDTGRQAAPTTSATARSCYGGGAGEVVGEGCVQAFTSGCVSGRRLAAVRPRARGRVGGGGGGAARSRWRRRRRARRAGGADGAASGGRRAAADDRARRPRLDAVHLALHTSAFEAIEETLVNARSSGEHEPEELRMKREMLEAMTLPVVRVFTAYELVPNELDTVKQVAEKLRGKVIFTLHRIATYATAKLLLDVGLDPSSPRLAGYARPRGRTWPRATPTGRHR